jgi:general secretion pathway protein J
MVDRPDRPAGEAGFTLLELLIAVTLMGLVVLGLTHGVRFAGAAWSSQAERIGRQGDVDAVQNVLRRTIESARDFRGDAATLRFVGEMPRALARGGAHEIELRLVADRLVLSWRPHVKASEPPAEPASAELARGVAGLELAYFSRADGGGWRPDFGDDPRPPALVRLAVRGTDGRAWPALVVAPMIEAPPGAMGR